MYVASSCFLISRSLIEVDGKIYKFEVSGQTQNFGQKKKGQLVKTVETGLMGIINGVTDGSVHNLNPSDYENIPESSSTPGI
ncbi:hypothetical protein [Peribacillus sp. TH16]|uniref:hypothetical protein n=1 Tax=Peribacillus sp. TH16 TaxID=2798482 RepID=UPI00406D3ABC